MANALSHVGVIMDGNRRWAKKRGLMSVLKGHEQGVRKLMELCVWCQEKEIPFLSVYAFSTENWNRSSMEIDGLFAIMEKFFHEEIADCIEKGIRIRIVGDKDRLKDQQRDIIAKAERETENCSRLLVQIAISYGGHDELVRAMRKMAVGLGKGEFKPDDITEEMVSTYLDTAGVPMIDAVIRTGGNHRLSNFFTWQTAYSEIYFTDTLWPDFTKEEFTEIVDHYRDITINLGK